MKMRYLSLIILALGMQRVSAMDSLGMWIAEPYVSEEEKQLNEQLAQAIQERQLDKIPQLVQQGARIDNTIILEPHCELKPLGYAVWKNDEELVRALIKNGASAKKNPLVHIEATLLQFALSVGADLRLIVYLTENGAAYSVNGLGKIISGGIDSGNNSPSPLALAEYLGRHDVINYFRTMGRVEAQEGTDNYRQVQPSNLDE